MIQNEANLEHPGARHAVNSWPLLRNRVPSGLHGHNLPALLKVVVIGIDRHGENQTLSRKRRDSTVEIQ